MSRIAEMAKQMKLESDMEQLEEKKRVAVSMRVDDFTRFCLDKFAGIVGVSRASLCQELVSEGVLEGFEAIGTSLDDLHAMFISERSGRDIEEVRADLAKTGLFVGEEKINV